MIEWEYVGFTKFFPKNVNGKLTQLPHCGVLQLRIYTQWKLYAKAFVPFSRISTCKYLEDNNLDKTRKGAAS